MAGGWTIPWGSALLAGRTLGVRRLVFTTLLLLAALLTARYAWQAPLTADAERALYDLRVWTLAPRVDQDQRIAMVTFTDETLANTGRRSPLDRGLLARALTRIDALGARAIGIDILVDQPQPEDPALLAALSGMRTPTYLAFASATTNPDSVKPWQEDFQRRFQEQARPGARPASVRLETDIDNVIRSWPRHPAGDPGLLSELVAGRTGDEQAGRASIAFRMPRSDARPLFASVPIDLFGSSPAAARLLRSQIEGRYVLIGGDISDVDRIDTPMTRLTGRPTTGLEIHAAMLAQILDAHPRAVLSSILLWALALSVVLMAAALAFGDLGVWAAPILVLEVVVIAALPFGLHAIGFDTQTLPAFGWLAGWSLAYGASIAAARGVGSEQRRFAQSALGRYLPPEIAKAILRDPSKLTLTGERRQIYALFSDIEGFTTLTHAVSPETTATLLNAYLDRISDVVLSHGGTIDKFVGDSVVAIWGAPIARENDGEQAIRAAVAIAAAGDGFTGPRPDGGPGLGRTRVGVHRGQAIVGNFGGDGRIQYTALGDVMNTAARLESANKSMGTQVLLSAEAIEGVTGLVLRPLGCVSVRGRPAPLEVFDTRADLTPDDALAVGRLIQAVSDDVPEAHEALETYARARPHDPALAKLCHRLKFIAPGGCYALD
jgi:adenylate cyclase